MNLKVSAHEMKQVISAVKNKGSAPPSADSNEVWFGNWLKRIHGLHML